MIILGMHRSGTTMVARMLRECGLFVGRSLEHNCESRPMIALNDWLLAQCSARWDHPGAIDLLLNHPEVRPVTVEYLRAMLAGFGALGFTGLARLAAAGFKGPTHPGCRPQGPWGWKDPRNTFTLPIWREVFGGARVIHVLRHGMDVADSMVRRTPRQLEQSTEKLRRYRRWCWLRPKSGGFADTLRIGDHASAMKLWHAYASRARHHVAELGDHAVEVRYEHFLGAPAEHLADLAEFCGLRVDAPRIEQVASSARASRRYAFTADRELRDLCGRFTAELADFGYGPDGEIGGSSS